MSGTSADGVDVAVTRVRGRGLGMSAELLHHHHVAYDGPTRHAVFQIRESGQVELKRLAELGRLISLAYARGINEALAQSRLDASDVTAVAAHGQTLFHSPPDTIQWLDPSLIASQTGCAVVSDFRRADCAAAGQGAPLVPFADWILFRHPTRDRILVNIGGIANVTCLFAGAPLEKVLAFDTGPGNCISDYLIRKHRANDLGFDRDGEVALRGKVHPELHTALLSHPYFVKLGPKSTDGPAMIALFEQALREVVQPPSLEDQLLTAAHLTAFQIVRATSLFGGQFHGDMIISGGGTKNPAILSALRSWRRPILTTDEFGVKGDAKEALAFAILGAATLDGVPSNVPSATGANRAVVLGSVTPKPA